MSLDLAVSDARARAGQIRNGIHDYLRTLGVIAEAFRLDDWRTLGYANWEAYLDGEFSSARLRLSPEFRQKAVEELRLAGMGQRAIAAVVGVDRETVAKDLGKSQVAGFQPPETTKGTDGKKYASTKPAAEPRPAPQAPPETPAAPVEDEPDAAEATPEVDGAAIVRDLVENDEEAKAREFMKNFNAALHRAGLVYGFDAGRLAELAEPRVIQSMEHHLQLMAAFLSEVKRLRGRPLRVVGGTAS